MMGLADVPPWCPLRINRLLSTLEPVKNPEAVASLHLPNAQAYYTRTSRSTVSKAGIKPLHQDVSGVSGVPTLDNFRKELRRIRMYPTDIGDTVIIHDVPCSTHLRTILDGTTPGQNEIAD